MSFVVDASVAVKWLIDEPNHELARALLALDIDLLAPDIVVLEVGNALCKKVERNEISSAQAISGVQDVVGIFDVLTPSTALISRGMEIAVAMRHPIYDCIYLAYAERSGSTFVTDDRRLASKSRSAGLSVVVQLLTGASPVTPS